MEITEWVALRSFSFAALAWLSLLRMTQDMSSSTFDLQPCVLVFVASHRVRWEAATKPPHRHKPQHALPGLPESHVAGRLYRSALCLRSKLPLVGPQLQWVLRRVCGVIVGLLF